MPDVVACSCGSSNLSPCVCELRETCFDRGKYLGTVAPSARFYLLDGAVYCVRSQTQVDYSGTLAEFVKEDERRGDRGGRRILRQFFHYHAGRLAIDPERPWQVCSETGLLVAQFPDELAARTAAAALIADKLAGNLPFNLSTWDKSALLR